MSIAALQDAAAAIAGATSALNGFVGASTSRENAIAAARPLGQEVLFVSPATGSDAANVTGLDPNLPLLTLDRALSLSKADGTTVIMLNGNVTLTTRRFDLAARTTIIQGRSTFAAGGVPQARQVTFQNFESANPAGDYVAGMGLVHGKRLAFNFCDLVLPAASSKLYQQVVIGNSDAFISVSDGAVTRPAGSSAKLLWQQRGRMWAAIDTVVATNMAGGWFEGVAAGANPNATAYSYQSNLTAG